MRSGALFLIAVFLLPLFGAGLSYAEYQPAEQATIITYNIPIAFAIQGNTTVTANSTANIDIQLPYQLSSNASISLYYKLTDTNGTLLSSGNGVTIQLLDSDNNTTVTTVYLASDSPAEATIPLSAVPSGVNLTAIIQNTLSSDVQAQLEITVLDAASFKVSLSSDNVQVKPGDSATVKVTIEQVGGPAGTLFLEAKFDNDKLTATLQPDQIKTSSGGKYTVDWTITAENGIAPGKYTGTLVGYFKDFQVPGRLSSETYTFAEVIFPIMVSGGTGALLGSIMGAQFGWWAVAIVIILILAVAVAVLYLR